MPEKTGPVTFTYSQVVEALIKYQGIHEGLWGIYVEYGLAASNLGPNQNELQPAAIVPIMKLGLQKVDNPSNLTADAEKVNPR